MSGGDRKLVYVLVHDLLIGVKFEARVVELMPDESFSLNHVRLDPFNYRNFDVPITDDDKILLKTLRELTYDKLVENFSRMKSELPDLLHVKGDDFFKKVFRPYVERRLVFLIGYCNDHDIPVYQLNSGGAILEEPYHFAEVPAKVSYHFQWTPQALTYAIRVSVAGSPVVLHSPSLILLTDQPAWIAYLGGLYTMDGVNGNKLKPFLDKDSLVIPRQTEKKYFATFVRGLLRQTSISQSGFTIKEVDVFPEPDITLCVDWANDPVLIVKFRYGKHEIPMDYSDPRLVEMNDEFHPPSFDVTVRKLTHEKQIVDMLCSMGSNPKGSSALSLAPSANGTTDPMARLIEFTRFHYQVLQELGITIRQEPGSRYLLSPPVIKSSVQMEHDWFDLEIVIEVGDQKIPFKLLKECILNGRQEYVTPDGSVFLIPEEWFSRFRGVFLFGKSDGNRYKISKLHLGSLSGALDNESMADMESPGNIIRRLFEGQDELRGSAAHLLRPYQGIGVQWLLGLGREGFGGCLADDMGLGKTVQVLAMLDSLRLTGGSSRRTSLVVMPVSLLHNWENEIRKFTPGQKFYRYAGAQRNADPDWIGRFDIVLTTYGTLRNDIDLLETIDFFYLILDESQHAKNADSVTFRAIIRVHAANRLSMTGTPVENSLDDLWSQMTLVNQGMLGSRNWFRDHFIRPRTLSEADGSLLLREMVKPFILRRTKEAVAPELPQLTQEIRYCEPTEEQWSVYESRKSDIRNFLINRFREPVDGTTRMLILQSLMRLRLIANHPVMADPGYSGGSGKMTEMIGMIGEIVAENHKVLVFSQFVKHLKLIAATLDLSGIPYVMLTGQDTAKKREMMIRRFQKEDSLPVFLVSLKAGGVGLNLTRADYVFLADPWWNPAVENQAISRAHRIGQENHVFAYRFITSGTIEEKILLMQERKQNLADIFVNRNALNLINPGEILDLLS